MLFLLMLSVSYLIPRVGVRVRVTIRLSVSHLIRRVRVRFRVTIRLSVCLVPHPESLSNLKETNPLVRVSTGQKPQCPLSLSLTLTSAVS